MPLAQLLAPHRRQRPGPLPAPRPGCTRLQTEPPWGHPIIPRDDRRQIYLGELDPHLIRPHHHPPHQPGQRPPGDRRLLRGHAARASPPESPPPRLIGDHPPRHAWRCRKCSTCCANRAYSASRSRSRSAVNAPPVPGLERVEQNLRTVLNRRQLARQPAPDAPAPLQLISPNATPFHAPCNRRQRKIEHLFGAGTKKGAGYQHSRACIQPRACQPPTGNLCSYLAAHIAPRRTPCPLFQPWLLRYSQPPRPTLFDHDRDFSVARLNTHSPDLLHESANHLLGHGSILAHTF